MDRWSTYRRGPHSRQTNGDQLWDNDDHAQLVLASVVGKPGCEASFEETPIEETTECTDHLSYWQ